MSIIFLEHKGYLQKRPENESTRWVGRKIKEKLGILTSTFMDLLST